MTLRVPHVCQHLRINTGDDGVQGVVHADLRLSQSLGAGDRLQRAVVGGLQRKVDDGGGATKRCAPRATGKGVTGDRLADHVFKVDVRIYAARQNEQTGGVHPGHLWTDFDVLADHANDAVVQQQVGHIVIDRRDDAAVLNEGGSHRYSACSRARTRRLISSTVL